MTPSDVTRAVAGPPSTMKGVLAVSSLIAITLTVLLAVIFLLKQPTLLVGTFVGLAVAGTGGWWLITEQNPRRAFGIALLVIGALLVIASFWWASANSEGALWRLLILLVLLAVAISTARGALVRNLHDIDRMRANRVQPTHPVLICNRKSGGGKVDKFGLPELAAELGVEVVFLEPGLDLAQIARDAVARGADCLGMAGGDGSQALVASIAIETGVPFVCISAGTRNHFALDLGLDREDPRKGMIALRDGVERFVDYATVGDRLFVNNVSLGVYATIVQEDSYRDAKTETTKEKLPELLGRQAEPFDLQFDTPDGQHIDGAFLILVSNNPYVMGPSLNISQRNAMDTGKLGVFAVNAATGAEAGRLIARSTLGLGKRDPNLHQFEATTFEVQSRSGRALAGVDGESLDLPTPLEFRIHPHGMRILMPADDILTAERRRARNVNVKDLLTVAAGHVPSRLQPTSPSSAR